MRTSSAKIAPNLSLLVKDRGNTRDIYPLVVRLTSDLWRSSDYGGASFEDAVSEALVQLLQARRRYKKSSKVTLTTFLYKRIHGSGKDLIRRELRNSSRFVSTDPVKLPERLTDSNGFVDTLLEKLFAEQVLSRISADLSPTHARILALSYGEDRSESFIAQDLKLSFWTVRRMSMEALQHARKVFSSSRRQYRQAIP